MKATRKQKAKLREYFSYMPLKFMADGRVLGKKRDCWGLLYTPEQLNKILGMGFLFE